MGRFFGTQVHETTINADGSKTITDYTRTESSDHYAKGQNANGETTGAMHWEVRADGSQHITFVDINGQVRRSWEVENNGKFERHDSSKHKIDGSNHLPGAYNGRFENGHEIKSCEFVAEKGDYYYDGNHNVRVK